MPLVVPGLQSKGSDDKTNKWMNDLVGKKLGDSSNETVCQPITQTPHPSPLPQVGVTRQEMLIINFSQTFAKKDLPKEHRVLGPNDMATMDHKPER